MRAALSVVTLAKVFQLDASGRSTGEKRACRRQHIARHKLVRVLAAEALNGARDGARRLLTACAAVVVVREQVGTEAEHVHQLVQQRQVQVVGVGCVEVRRIDVDLSHHRPVRARKSTRQRPRQLSHAQRRPRRHKNHQICTIFNQALVFFFKKIMSKHKALQIIVTPVLRCELSVYCDGISTPPYAPQGCAPDTYSNQNTNNQKKKTKNHLDNHLKKKKKKKYRNQIDINNKFFTLKRESLCVEIRISNIDSTFYKIEFFFLEKNYF